MNSNNEGYCRSQEWIEFYVSLTCGAALIGWILYSAPRDVAAKAAGSNPPDVRAAGSEPSAPRNPEPSAGIHPDDRTARHASPPVRLALSRKAATLTNQ